MTGKSGSLIRWTGFAAGCLLGVGVVLAGRLPEGRAATGVGLRLSAQPTEQVGVAPAGKSFLEARDLRPGERPDGGRLTVSNYTGRKLTVSVRAHGTDSDLDDLVRVRLAADEKTVFTGKLSELRSAGAARFGLGPKGRRTLEASVSLPASVRRDYQGRSAALELRLRAAGEGR